MEKHCFTHLYYVFFCFTFTFLAIISISSNAATVTLPYTPDINSVKPQYLIIPVPDHTIALSSVLALNEGKRQIKGSFIALALWPRLAHVTSKKYIRLLLINFNGFLPIASQLQLTWQYSIKKSNINRANAYFKRDYLPIKTANYLTFPSLNWLTKALLLHDNFSKKSSLWYIEPQKMYANYVTNTTLLAKNGYNLRRASQWLYDKPQAIYQLFIMTGDRQWLKKANDLVKFYQTHIDDRGRFTLKKNLDIKYLMPKGLLYRFLLSGDFSAKDDLAKLYQSSLKWNPHYDLGRGFWTERNQAAALNVAVSYWELTEDKHALARIHEIISATVKMTFNPEGDWPLRGCPQHSFKSHEGWGDNTPACSPWMMALLGDALWRYYRLTHDKSAAALIDAFGDFILNYGLFYGDKRVNNIVIPKYIVAIENNKQEELNQWTDPQHACDVAALTGKSIYIKEQNNQDSFLLKSLFNALLEQCQNSYTKLKKTHKKQPYLLLKPPRSFGWMYSTTSDLPWLNNRFNHY